MKKSVLALVLLAASFNFAFVSKVFSASTDPAFTEIWAYLMKGEERFLNQNYGITDIGYFAGEIDNFGKLTGVPNRSKIANFNGRIHLVIAQVSNRALTHFALDPQYNIREKLIDDIVKATQNFDGLQIDFELVAPQDREYFYTFLIALKERISPKPLSIAIGARTKYVDDAYEYEKIAGIVDRVIIMAYDEHWSTSSPGPIASFAWCAQVAQYALAHIPVQKIVMGMPFYGRAWANINPSRAYKHEGIANLIASKKIANVNVKDDIPYFTYQQTVNVTVYYENSLTIMKRSKIYYDLKIKNIAFWRLGQEEVSVWDGLAKSLFTDEVFLNQAIAKPAPAPKPKTQTAQTKKSQSPPKKTTAAKK